MLKVILNCPKPGACLGGWGDLVVTTDLDVRQCVVCDSTIAVVRTKVAYKEAIKQVRCFAVRVDQLHGLSATRRRRKASEILLRSPDGVQPSD